MHHLEHHAMRPSRGRLPAVLCMAMMMGGMHDGHGDRDGGG